MYIDTVDVNETAVLISVRSRSCFCIGIGPLKMHIKQVLVTVFIKTRVFMQSTLAVFLSQSFCPFPTKEGQPQKRRQQKSHLKKKKARRRAVFYSTSFSLSDVNESFWS